MSTEFYHALVKFLKKSGLSTTVGDEGSYAPKFDGIDDALDSIVKAIKDAGYKPGKDVKIVMGSALLSFLLSMAPSSSTTTSSFQTELQRI